MARHPRVLHVLAEDIVGGTELLIASVAKHMHARGVAVGVATFFSPGPVHRQLTSWGIPVWALGGRGPAVSTFRLARLLARRHYDVVECYGFKVSVLGRLAARVRRPRPLVVCGVMGAHITEVVELDELKGRFALAVERMLTRMVDAYEVNSQGAIELLARNGIAYERMRYIPNAIDMALWRPGSPGVGRPPLIVCPARFVERKRQVDVIRALRILIARGRSCRLVLAGEGPTKAYCESHAQDLGVRDHVEFPGALSAERLAALLTEASVVVLASVWEGMPAAVLEAMACEVPVVGTAVNGVTDLVIDGVTGRLTSVRRPDELANAIESLLTDPARAREMGRAGRRQLETRYSLETMVEAKLALYNDALARGARGSGGSLGHAP
jgi:glycosyltransferase involved in cell wall biosynthesis